jgi:hypothetical protein
MAILRRNDDDDDDDDPLFVCALCSYESMIPQSLVAVLDCFDRHLRRKKKQKTKNQSLK